MSHGKDPRDAKDQRHEELCAYLFGELSGADRARIEQALAGSEELREELARLEATAALVRDAYAGEERLSEGAMAELARAAASPPPPLRLVWYRGPALRAAAAVLVMAGGLAYVLSTDLGAPSLRPDELSAKLEAPRANRPEAPREAGVELEETLPAAEPAPDARAERVIVGEAESLEGVVRNGLSSAAERDAGRSKEAAPGASEAGQAELAARARVLGQGQVQQQDEPQVLLFDDTVAVDKALDFDEKVVQEWLAGGKSAACFRAYVGPGDTIAGGDDFQLGKQLKLLQSEDAQGVLSRLAAGRAESAPSTGPSSPGAAGPAAPATPLAPGAGGGGALEGKRFARAGAEPLGELGYGEPETAEAREAYRFTPEEQARKDELERLGELTDEELGGWLERERDAGARGHVDRLRVLGAERRLSADELDLLIRRRCDEILAGCRRRPEEKPRDMYFRFWGDNAFQLAAIDALSTFSVDVDTASYALARRYLRDGHLPEKAQVRTEEFLNYFAPDLAPPAEGTFAVHTELAPSLFASCDRDGKPRADVWMLRVGVRGKEIPVEERRPLALTFVVDTSGSMKEGQRLELVKHAVRLLAGELDARDSIALVAFSSEARLILPMTSAAQRGVIESAIHPLSANGSTNAAAGLRMGYELALAGLRTDGHNRVVLLSDGVANTGQTDQTRILADVRGHREKGIYLNTIGVGMNNHNDVFLEQLADKGDGICDYVDDEKAAQRAIVERFTGAFQPIASDVKIQVEFDPRQVVRYRLLGYENRAIADADFRNDLVDAGEVGSGHQVVALYELERLPDAPAEDAALATVRLRWKAPKVANQDPREVDVTEIEAEVRAASAAGSFGATSKGFRRSALVAQLAELLRRSSHAFGDSYETLLVESEKLRPELSDPDFDEFVALAKRAGELILRESRPYSALGKAVDEYRRLKIFEAELECLKRERGRDLLDELRQQNQSLEDRIRDLIRTELREKHG